MARLIAQFVTLTTYRVTKLTHRPLLFVESSPLPPPFAQSMRDKSTGCNNFRTRCLNLRILTYEYWTKGNDRTKIYIIFEEEFLIHVFTISPPMLQPTKNQIVDSSTDNSIGLTIIFENNLRPYPKQKSVDDSVD